MTFQKGRSVMTITKKIGTMQNQLELERESKEKAEELLKFSYAKAQEEGRGGQTKIGSELVSYSLETCENNIKKLFFAKKKRGVVADYQGVINTLKDVYKGKEEKLIHTLFITTMNILVSYAVREAENTPSISFLSGVVAGTLIHEVEAEMYISSISHSEAKYFDKGLNCRVSSYFKERYARRVYNTKNFVGLNIKNNKMVKLCFKLIELCIKGSGYFEIGYTEHTNKQGKTERLKTITARQWLIETWNKNVNLLAFNKHRYYPCVVSPKKWSDVWTGAYYGENAKFSQFIRQDFFKKNIFMSQYIEKLEQLDLSWIFDVVNHLQETPFVINEKVLNVCLDIMSNHGNLGGLPSTDEMPKMPMLINPTEKELKSHKRKLTMAYKKERARQSKMLRTNSTLAVAKKYSEYAKIYFPWNMDYRGRLYPMPTEINPQGDDLQKALLLFAEPEPLTDNECLKWFYIAGAGFAGLDKKPFQERITWVLEHENQIISSAKAPLEFTWWDEVAGDESPLCFLSFCFEFKRLREYQADHEGSAIGFKTGLHISFDGTCSGLQHFSMLLADEIGGRAVNLVPDETVHDIYQVVADKVNVVLKKDVVSGTEDTYKLDKKTGEVLTDSEGNKKIQYGTKELATQWMMYGKEKFGTEGIKRKVCKRSVMTLAYGSGRYGFAENLKSDIIKPWQEDHEDNPIFIDKKQASTYMAGLIWDAVSTTVVKAVEGMEWLRTIASEIAKQGEVVCWLSPNGLPIQQNKFEVNMKVYQMRFAGVATRVYLPEQNGMIDKRAQAQAIAPNFIHSLDACHMQRVIQAEYKQGNRNFFMIHDSFGTDLAHANSLFNTIREQLVKMYKDKNYLKDWLSDVEYLLPEDAEIPDIPEKGNLNIEDIKKSKYCFA